MGSRGTFRGIYTALIDDQDYQALAPHDRLVLLTARLCFQASIASIFRYYPGVLMVQTGLSGVDLTKALTHLHAGRWIDHEYPIIWVRNGLRFDPSIRLADDKHRKAIEKHIAGLPHLGVVLRFCDYYDLPRPFEDPSKTLPSPSLGFGIGTGTGSSTGRGSGGNHERLAQAREVIAWLNEKTGKHFETHTPSGRPTANLDLVLARLSDGREVWQIKAVISRKVREWTGTEQAKYLRPATLFNKTKFEQYIAALPVAVQAELPDGP